MNISKNEYRVSDLVIDDEYGTIYSNSTIEEAAKKMKEISIPDLVVVEKESNKVLGVIDDFDIVQNVVALGENPKTTTVNSKMYIITPVNTDTLVAEAFKRMRDLKVSIVPVVENDKLVGVCSIFDCWSYIPEESPDQIGLIPVSSSKVVEFWFSSICAILAFVFGILLPIAGVYGFFFLSEADMINFLGTVGLTGGSYSFSFFNASGADLLITLASIASERGVIWIVILVLSILNLIFALIALFSLIYSGFSDMRGIRNPRIVKSILPIVPIILMIIQWFLYGTALSPSISSVSPIIDIVGLFMSIFSMLLFILAISRDYVFRSKEGLVLCKPERGE
ncbi:MAG: CBS domain-containing protein [Promethearchaeota archaeon]